jgi:phosphate transport system permease protein
MVDKFWTSGEPFIWATAAVLSIVVFLLLGLLGIVFYNGLGVFWQKEIVQFELKNGKKYLGEIAKREVIKVESGESDQHVLEKRIQIKRGNREIDNMDFVWIDEKDIVGQTYPLQAIEVEREKNGNFIGFIKTYLKGSEGTLADNENFKSLNQMVSVKVKAYKEKQKEVYKVINNRGLHLLELQKIVYYQKKNGVKLDLDGEQKLLTVLPEMSSIKYLLEKNLSLGYLVGHEQSLELLRKIIKLNKDYLVLKSDLEFLEKDSMQEKIVLVDINGVEKTTSISHVVRLIYPNKMTFFDKTSLYFSKIKELLFDNPRESNTEGGLFPAIVGTVMMVFLMSFLSFPLGVISGVYLREYAKEGFFIRLVRIAVNNLAGIPSIVYGIFGLGFFVYFIGSNIDGFFYPEQLPAPNFGTGGILWASLTLGILTVPVVIVSTEEALGSIPREIRQGSLALGATKFQTLYGVLLPMASPGILTGFILAMSRAAGEVAPLMITGVVKTAHALPVDNDWPYIHLDRKFMHLGYQVFDVGFQSPNVEASTPMVYITTLLLLTIVFSLSLGAIILRNKMKKRYTVKSF